MQLISYFASARAPKSAGSAHARDNCLLMKTAIPENRRDNQFINKTSPPQAENFRENYHIKNFELWLTTNIKTENNIIFTDQRLTCGQKVENLLYKLIPADSACIPCHKCGVWISDESAEKFHQLEEEFNTILPCCDYSKCSKGPNQGWKMTTGSKKKVILKGGARKRPRAPPSDCDFTIPPLRVYSWGTCQEWLAESRHAWRQQRQKRSQKKQ